MKLVTLSVLISMTLEFEMPIGLEQWRAQIGLFYASHMPQILVVSKGRKYRQIKWSSLLSLCLALVNILFRTIADAIDTGIQVPKKAASWLKAQLSSFCVIQSLPTHTNRGRRGLSILLTCLMVVQMLLIMSGDVEENPGPLTRQESRLEVGDLVTVQDELVIVTDKWRNIGLGLGFRSGTLNEIQEQRSDPSSRLQEVLDRWLRTVCPPPTWERLAKALERPAVGEYRLAQQLKKKYCKPQQTAHDDQCSDYSERDLPTITSTAGASHQSYSLQLPSKAASNLTSVEMKLPALHTDQSVHQPSPGEAAHLYPSHPLQHKTITAIANGGNGEGKRRVDVENDLSDASVSTEPSTLEEVNEELHQQAFGCGCGPCSFQSFLDKGCPNPISTTKSLVPYLDTSELDDTQKDYLMGRLYDEFEEITVAFSRLVIRTKKSLIQQKITPGQLIEILSELGAFQPTLDDQKPLLEERLDDMRKESNIGGIFSILREYWSFFSFRILEYIIEQLGCDQDRQNLSEYTQKLQHYCKRSVFECPACSLPRTKQADLVMKVHRELTPKWTMEHVTKFRYKISKIIGVLHSTLRLCTIEKGCIQLRYQLPCSVAAVVFPLTIEQEVALRAEGVHKLRCTFGENCYEFPVERAEPKVTLANSRPPTLESAHLTVTEQMRGRPLQVVAGHENLGPSARTTPSDSQSASNSKASVISTNRDFTNFIRMFMTAQLKEQGCTNVLNQVPDFEELGDNSHLVMKYMAARQLALEEQWQQQFEDMIRQLELTEENLKLTYEHIVRETFKDRIHWGLIVTFLMFSSAFAVFCAQNRMESRVGDVVAWTEAEMQRMNEWMIQKGGWEAFVEYFHVDKSTEVIDIPIDIPRLLIRASVVAAIVVGAAILVKKLF